MLSHHFNQTTNNQQQSYHPYPFNHVHNNNNQLQFEHTTAQSFNKEYELQSVNNDELNPIDDSQNYDEEGNKHYCLSDDTFTQDQELTIEHQDTNIINYHKRIK
jgi:hypothetical protein